MEESILNNLHHIRSRIEKACAASGRRTEEVKLLLATKTVSADRIAVALGAGATLIAENKLQELKAKYEALRSMPHTNHFIGHLQTNKIKELLRYDVVCLQSLDRLELAEKLSQRLVLEGKTMDVLIQVNTSDEESKFGVHPDQALDLVRAVALLPNVRVRGLMTIGLFSAEEEKVCVCFQRLRAVQELVKEAAIEGVEMVELSMGMSGDLEIAIAEGATIVRVGTAVFGERQYPDSYYWKE